MDTTFAFWPVDYNRTFPQYTCQWHPCADVSPRVPVAQSACGSQGVQRCVAGKNEVTEGLNNTVVGGEEVREDSDRASGSSDAGEPSSSDSSATSSGAFEWPPHSHSRWEAHRQQSRGGWNVGQSNPPCPCEQSAAKRPHNDDWQGGRLRHSWDALWGPPEQQERGAQRGQAARVSSKGEAQQARGVEHSLAPGWQRDLGCLAQWAHEAASVSQSSRHPVTAVGMVPEPPPSPSHSLRSPRALRQSASLSGGHKRSFSRAPTHSPVGDAPATGPSYRSPRARRQAARLSEPGQPHKYEAGVETSQNSCSECCALCNDVLDLNRALYRTDCGVLCHLQCVRAERNQSPIMCRFCGQADQWLASSPHRPEHIGVH